MTALVTGYAIVGRSFPTETFEGLSKAFFVERRDRRSRRSDRSAVWKGQSESIVVPKRLTA